MVERRIDYLDETQVWETFHRLMSQVLGSVDTISNTTMNGRPIDASEYPAEVEASLRQ